MTDRDDWSKGLAEPDVDPRIQAVRQGIVQTVDVRGRISLGVQLILWAAYCPGTAMHLWVIPTGSS